MVEIAKGGEGTTHKGAQYEVSRAQVEDVIGEQNQGVCTLHPLKKIEKIVTMYEEKQTKVESKNEGKKSEIDEMLKKLMTGKGGKFIPPYVKRIKMNLVYEKTRP